jgi:hypothetical protein
MKPSNKLWLARTLIGVVLIINLQSAFVFFFKPEAFAPAYELTGIPGQTAIRGLAVLFLMWNVPYIVALINPIKFRISLYEAIAMQSIGLIGETLILWGLPEGHETLHSSIIRFIIFDGCGLAALILAAWITKSLQRGNK